MSELMTFLSNKKVVTNDMESATTTLAQRVGFEPTGDCSHDGFRVRVAIRTLKENGGNSRTMREFANP